ncbi:hypothetical protein ACO0LO_01910 [Undibacterium sp. TJN25]|uniref:hypothetical protein n=1 Tax=Undibacterium sp. TJN25 TaxID=3413056 RepID=UPI003BF043D1
MSVVSIGFNDFLMPAETGIQVVKLLQRSVKCHGQFEGDVMIYQTSKRPELRLEIIGAAQIKYPSNTDAEVEQ